MGIKGPGTAIVAKNHWLVLVFGFTSWFLWERQSAHKDKFVWMPDAIWRQHPVPLSQGPVINPGADPSNRHVLRQRRRNVGPTSWDVGLTLRRRWPVIHPSAGMGCPCDWRSDPVDGRPCPGAIPVSTATRINTSPNPSKHDTLNQWRFKVGPTSVTVGQH